MIFFVKRLSDKQLEKSGSLIFLYPVGDPDHSQILMGSGLTKIQYNKELTKTI